MISNYFLGYELVLKVINSLKVNVTPVPKEELQRGDAVTWKDILLRQDTNFSRLKDVRF